MVELTQYGPWIRRALQIYLRLRPWIARLREVAGVDAQLRIRVLNKRSQSVPAPPPDPPDLKIWAAAAVRRYRSKFPDQANPAGKLQ
jgi:hypothetical protein